MLKIDTIESTSEIVFRLHGRLAGPWVDELESHWRRMQATAGERPVRVDLSGVTGIDAAARYLLQLMRVRNVSLVGACLAIRASLDDDPTPAPGPLAPRHTGRIHSPIGLRPGAPPFARRRCRRC